MKTSINQEEVLTKINHTFALKTCLLLVFSVTPFKIDQNKNQCRSIDKVQTLRNERR